jgi:hypothetical protein
VTLTASYTFGGVEKTATKVITLSKRTLVAIEITGDEEIANGGTAAYVCTATWSDGAVTTVTPEWNLSSNDYAAVDADGRLTNNNMTDEDQMVVLNTSYTVGDVTETTSVDITLKGVPQPSQMLELRPGWNMVTLTKPLKDNSDGVQKFLSLRPLMLDVEDSFIVVCNDAASVKAGIGYWIFSRQQQTVELVQDTESPVSHVDLKPGWNFVGMTDDAAWPASDTPVWTWQNGRFVSVAENKLQVGYAYWIYLDK